MPCVQMRFESKRRVVQIIEDEALDLVKNGQHEHKQNCTLVNIGTFNDLRLINHLSGAAILSYGPYHSTYSLS